MSMLEQHRQKLREEFSEFEDGFERYAYLVEISGLLPPMARAQHTENNLVKGCQSQVWIHAYAKDGCFWFDADSDTLIIKGVLLLLQDLLCGVPLAEAAALDLDVLSDAGLTGEFSDTRQKGIGAAMQMLKEHAVNLLTHNI